MMHSLVNTWGLVESQETRRHPLHAVRRGHTLRHPPGPRPAPHHAGHLEHRPHHRPPGPQTSRGPPHRHVGEADEARRRHHLVPLEASGRGQGRPRQRAAVVGPHRQVRPGLQLGRFGHRPRRRGPPVRRRPSRAVLSSSTSFAPAIPRGVIARLDPYESYYWSNEHKEDQPPYPNTLFVVDSEEVEDTYVRTAARMSLDVAAHPRVVHPRAVHHRDTGPFMASALGAGVPTTAAVHG